MIKDRPKKQTFFFKIVLFFAVIGAIIFSQKAFAQFFPVAVTSQDATYSNFNGAVGEERAASQPTQTPFPFDELTIPYLRSGEYESSLADLDEVLKTNNYTSYLTSYTSDNLRINGLLTIPTGEIPEGGFPAVVFVHGYIPPSTYRTLKNYEAYVDYLARQGIVVFKIDLRGHDQSEGEASGAYYSSDYVVDVLNAHSALQGLSSVNPQKVGLWGHSMAGNVTMRATVVNPEISRVVIWAGAVYTYQDFLEVGIEDTSYRPPSDMTERRRKRDELFAAHGSFDPQSWFWRQVPATNFFDGITANIQLHHAVNDTVVPIQYSRGLVRAAENTSVSVELFEYASGGHNITGGSFGEAMRRTVDFLKKEY